MDPQARNEAVGVLANLFQNIGRAPQKEAGGGGLGGLDIGRQLQEFATMPVELATIFLNMSVELAELVLKALADAGYTIVKGTTPL